VEDIIIALAHKDWGNNKTPQSGWYSSLNANWAPHEYNFLGKVVRCFNILFRIKSGK